MNFTEALIELKSGKKISRIKWDVEKPERIIKLCEDSHGNQYIQTYLLLIDKFSMDASLFLRDDWIIHRDNLPYLENCSFEDMFKNLQEGHTAKLNDWGEDNWIEFNPRDKVIEAKCFRGQIFLIEYEDLNANDWIIVN